MKRKAFLIWGLVIIQFNVTLIAVAIYLSLSKIIDAKVIAPGLGIVQLLVTLFGFGLILHFRFKETGRRTWFLVLCLPFYLISLFIGGLFMLGDLALDIFGAHDRLFGAIGEWAALDDPKPASPFSTIRKLDYAIFSIPSQYLGQWGLFVLLWLGCLDPRKPSKNRFIHIMKHGFRRKTELSARVNVSELART